MASFFAGRSKILPILPAFILALAAPAGIAVADQWNGAYVGAFAGLGNEAHKLGAPTLPLNVDGLGGRGPIGGIVAGYNMRISPQFLLGVQAEYEIGDTSGTLTAPSVSGSAEAGKEWGANVSLRGGFLPTDDTMIYVVGGYSHARYEAKASDSTGSLSVKSSFNGYHAGLGMESRLSEAASLRLEYRYEHYEKKNIGSATVPIDATPAGHTGRISLIWNFDNASGPSGATVADDWTGFFIGAQAGAGSHTTKLSYGSNELDGVGGSGLKGGIFTGYDFHFGPRTVVGLQMGVNAYDMDFESTIGTTSTHAKLSHAIHASARAGFLLQPETLLYMRGGWMRGYFEGYSGSISAKESSDGLLAGIGMETKMGGNINLRLEYQHVQFNDKNIAGLNIKPSMQTGSVGLVMKF